MFNLKPIHDFFTAVTIILVVVLWLYIYFAGKILIKKWGTFATIGLGLVIIPVISFALPFSFVVVKQQIEKDNMQRQCVQYLFEKYGLDQNHYTLTNSSRYQNNYVLDGEKFSVKRSSADDETLSDNYQDDLILETLNQYISHVLGYPTEIDSNLEYHYYTLEQRCSDDIVDLVKEELSFLHIFVYDNGDDIETVLTTIQENEWMLRNALGQWLSIYICTDTPSARTEGDLRSSSIPGKYIAYSSVTGTWYQEPLTLPE